jgi:pyruvate dehydrogenase E2 component (dihydrolipoamide acetyltransferase)
MIIEVRLPQWGMSMTEGSIGEWYKQEGDRVTAGEPLVAIETAKITNDLEATVSGVLGKILAQTGDIVPVQDLLTTITED